MTRGAARFDYVKPIAAAILLVSAVARADISPEPFAAAAAATPMPGSNAAKISMAKEEVVITLHDGFAVVDATFHMANAGKTATIKVGFPGEGVIVDGSPTYRAHRPLLGFTAWVGGKKVSSTVKKQELTTTLGPPGRQYQKRREETWHNFAAIFPIGKTTAVRVIYAVLADGYKGNSWRTDESFLDGTISYVLATGAPWAGRIGKATVRVRTADELSLQLVRVRDNRMPLLPKSLNSAEPPPPQLPKYGKREKTEVVLERSALEPTPDDNLEIVYAWKAPKRDWRNDREEAVKMEKAAAEAAAEAAAR